MKAISMRCLRVLLVSAVIFALAGCSSYHNLSRTYVSGSDYYNSAYRGHTHGQIVKEYGAPDRQVSDGEGGYILVYETYHTSSHVDNMGFVDHSVRKSYIQFFMDKNGVCYNVKTNKLAPGQAEEAFAAVAISTGIISGLSTLGFLAMMVPFMIH